MSITNLIISCVGLLCLIGMSAYYLSLETKDKVREHEVFKREVKRLRKEGWM